MDKNKFNEPSKAPRPDVSFSPLPRPLPSSWTSSLSVSILKELRRDRETQNP